MSQWIDSIQLIADGENVSAGVTDRPLRTIVNNLQYLKGIADQNSAGQALVAPNVTVISSAQVGQPVYWNPGTHRYELALAGVTTDAMTGVLKPVASSQVVGIVLSKSNSTTANLLILGAAQVDLTAALNMVSLTAGRYYLSALTPGVLTTVKPLLGVMVLISDGLGTVYVTPHLEDFSVTDHVHYSFNLTAYPAGSTTPPSPGGHHTITSADSTLPGWLPATDPSFNGLAPANAVFGYNIPKTAGLANVFPPMPLAAWSLLIHKQDPSLDLTTPLTVTVDPAIGTVPANNYVEVTVTVTGAVVGERVEAVIPNVSVDSHLQWDAYVSATNTVTLRVVNTDLIASHTVSAGTWTFKVFSTTADATDLIPINPIGLVQVDSNGIWWMSDCYGDAPWPTQLNTGSPFTPSPPGTCPRDGWPVELIFSFARLNFATNQNVVLSAQPEAGSPILVHDNLGNPATTGNLYLNLQLQQDLPAPVVGPIVNAIDTTNGLLHVWRFPLGLDSTLQVQVQVPTLFVPPTPKVRLRLWLGGTLTYTLPALNISYLQLPRPGSIGTPLTPPGSLTTLTINTMYALTAGQYLEVLSAPISVAAGDLLLFTIERLVSDGYAGDVELIRAEGTLRSA